MQWHAGNEKELRTTLRVFQNQRRQQRKGNKGKLRPDVLEVLWWVYPSFILLATLVDSACPLPLPPPAPNQPTLIGIPSFCYASENIEKGNTTPRNVWVETPEHSWSQWATSGCVTFLGLAKRFKHSPSLCMVFPRGPQMRPCFFELIPFHAFIVSLFHSQQTSIPQGNI